MAFGGAIPCLGRSTGLTTSTKKDVMSPNTTKTASTIQTMCVDTRKLKKITEKRKIKVSSQAFSRKEIN